MMSTKEIATASSALGNQLKAGIPIDQALIRLATLQPQYRDFWTRTTLTVQSGQPLSIILKELWPEALVSTVRAGEHSGRLDLVFEKIEETAEMQLTLRNNVFKLAYPIGMGLSGIVIFLGFMIFVLPTLAKSLNTKSNGFIFAFSGWLSDFANENWKISIVGIGVAMFSIAAWLKTKEAQQFILEIMLRIPVLKQALRDMYFGLWSNYMSMLVSAGITTTESLRLTAPILPVSIQESVLRFERDLSVNNIQMSNAADLSKQRPNDPRVAWWPFYISNAFIVAEQTGEVDRELQRVAPSLIKDGIKSLNTVIAFANVAALALSAMLIVSPLAAYYSEIFAAIQQAGR